MRQKISTVVDATLYRRAKLEAARSGLQIADVIEAALREHLGPAGPEEAGDSVVAATWASLAAPRRLVEQVLTEEEGLFDR
jgi:hypothetical protein